MSYYWNTFLLVVASSAFLGEALAQDMVRGVAGNPKHPYPVVRDVSPQQLDKVVTVLPGLNYELNDDSAELVFPINADESFYGMGERFDAWNLRGQQIKVWLRDRIQGGLASSYFAAPFFISSEGYGVFVNCSGAVDFDFGKTTADELRVSIPEGGIDLYVFKGTPAEIVSQYTSVIGRPQAVPDWVWGLWISRNSYLSAAEIDRMLDRLDTESIPVSAVVLEAWAESLQSFTFETDRYPEPKRWIESLHARDVAALLWITPSIWTSAATYPEAKELDFIVKDEDGNEVILDWLEGGRKINFDKPEARVWWTDLQRDLVAMGIDGFKTDGGERNPDPFFHNLQPYYYQKASLDAFEGSGRPGVTFARSASASCAGLSCFWAGDQNATWQSLEQLMKAGLSAALSGFSYYSHDIGAYIGEPDKELYVRWFQIGAFSPIMQWHGIGPREPWLLDDETLDIARYYSQMRERMRPYLKKTARQAHESGQPMWRPMLWAYPDDAEAYGIFDQFMLGNDLIVAPLIGPGESRSVYLPEGEWLDLFKVKVVKGPTRIDYNASLWEIPVFVPIEKAKKWLTIRGAIPKPQETGFVAKPVAPLGAFGVVQDVRYLDGQRGSLFWELENTTDATRSLYLEAQAASEVKVHPEHKMKFTLEPGERKRAAFYFDFPETFAGDSQVVTTQAIMNGQEIASFTQRFVMPVKWEVAGPFRGNVGTPDKSVVASDLNAKWVAYPEDKISPEGVVSFDEALHANKVGSYYAKTEIESDSLQSVSLSFGNGDSITIWINGEEVFDHTGYGNLYADTFSADALLKPGKNDILIRVTRNIGEPTFQFRIERNPGQLASNELGK
ncbi:TIM-barrel domain-containing protein [Rubellicoccus peritrichatus]|uniref:Glycoside hydrolase family 31 protein n=1 Tax=Rubellicoccus peritrichatus TaxID=3080537 RepID=A0AAQ3LAP7_9BACT|nr:TIM-barrel domain-containing protein [Puniceicoccus sp. CR14]WOO41787.1 glycoside hydrolase family 31 protein [Puniceicoccus sp. CR14]